MQSKVLRSVGIVALLLMVAAANLSAQTAAKQPQETVVGIALDSNYVRISDFLPRLRDSLVKTLTKPKKHIRAVAIDADPQDAPVAAAKKGCAYLLQMSVSETSGVGVGLGLGAFTPSPDMNPDEARQRQELLWVWIHYRLRSLPNSDFITSGTDYVRYTDLPIGWDASAYETTIFRVVTRVAVSTAKKLPKP